MNRRWAAGLWGMVAVLLVGFGFVLGRASAPGLDDTPAWSPPEADERTPQIEPSQRTKPTPRTSPNLVDEATKEPSGPKTNATVRKRQPGDAPLDPNTCTLESLQALPGVGPAMARRIQQSRDEHGAFQVKEDLLRVRGIGPKTLAKMAPFLALPTAAELALQK